MSFTEAAVSIIHVHNETSLAFYLIYFLFNFFVFICYYCNDKSDFYHAYSCTSYCMHLVINMDKSNLIREEKKTKAKTIDEEKERKERKEKKWFE